MVWGCGGVIYVCMYGGTYPYTYEPIKDEQPGLFMNQTRPIDIIMIHTITTTTTTTQSTKVLTEM